MSRPPDPPSNPYVDLPLQDLIRAMAARRGELMGGETVTRRDLAQLLAVVERRLDPRPLDPNSPTHLVGEGRSLSSSFLPGYELECKHLRWMCLEQAADAIGMTWEARRMATNDLWRVVSDLAQRDDAGLREALVLLQTYRERRAAVTARPSTAT